MNIRKTFAALFHGLKNIFYTPIISMERASLVRGLSLLLIVLIAFLVRIAPYFFYPMVLKAFDPYMQYRLAEHMLKYGIFSFFNWYDTMSWFPYGRFYVKTAYPGTPLSAVLLYYFFKYVLGLNVTLLSVAYFQPAIFGTLTAFLMYFLGKELGGSRVGLFAALFTAIVPGYLQRTIVGFFDNEAAGIFFMFCTIYFFIRALKRGSLYSSLVAGFSLGALTATWGASIYTMDLIPLAALSLVLLGRYSRRLLIAYTPTIGIGLLIAVSVPRIGTSKLFDSFGLPALSVLIFLLLVEIWEMFSSLVIEKVTKFSSFILSKVPKRVFEYKYFVFYMTLTAITAGLLAIFYYGLIPGTETIFEKFFGSKFWGTISPFYREQNQLFASVGEHLTSPWSIFYYNMHFITIFFVIGMYFLLKRGRDEDVLILLLGITSLYFAGSLIRLVLILAPTASLIGAYGINSVYSPFVKIFKLKPTVTIRRRKRVSKIMSREVVALAFAALFIILTLQTFHIATVDLRIGSPELIPSEQLKDWPEAMAYVNMYLPKNAVIVSWWDYGYWITTLGKRATVADGATINKTQIAMIGYAFMAPNITETLRVLRKFRATHILVYFGLFQQGLGGDENKWIWMVRIASDVFGKELINPDDYYNETSGEVLPKFFNSTIFKLLTYREPGGPYAQVVQQALYNPKSSYYEWGKHIQGPEVLQFIEEEYISTNHLVKIFRINWDAWYAYARANNISTSWNW